MTITYVTNIQPLITQVYDFYLLESYIDRMLRDFKEKILPLAEKKIKSRHIGKRREFEELKKQFMETYERKKDEEADYKAKIQEEAKKRPRIPGTGKTCTFKRFSRLPCIL